MNSTSPYHEGELAVQQRAGELARGRQNGQIIQDTLLRGAFRFLKELPLVIVGSRSTGGDIWASLLLGRTGFVSAADEHAVELDRSRFVVDPMDPLWSNLRDDPHLGMLAIDLATRRRLRVNGTLEDLDADPLRLLVSESYPNCPKYIQRRHLQVDFDPGLRDTPGSRQGRVLEEEQRALIRVADTFFVATAHPERGVDVSHRGGVPGFVQLGEGGRLRIPDYTGNSMFNTLGNLSAYPHAGLLFLDFERGRSLQLTGHAALQWDAEDDEHPTGGTGRYWTLDVERWREAELPPTFRFELLEASPYNPR